MKFLDNIAKRFTKTASTTVKKEARKTLIDLIPGALAIGTMIVGMLVFHEIDGDDKPASTDIQPRVSTTRITTNNYFLGEVSDDIIKRILEGNDHG